ncbi:response regulator [Pigmentiphaga aceris]|nr:response regulator [Pigmentiphaga aceris]
MRILIVEDDPAHAYQAVATLEAEGHEVFGPALNSDEAFQWASSENLELALVAVEFGGQRAGIELARQLHGRHGLPAVFVSTADGVAPEHQDAALGLLRKPFEPADLVDSVLVAQCLLNGGWPPPPPVPRPMEIFHRAGMWDQV